MKRCYSRGCKAKVVDSVNGYPVCFSHYKEAIEHGADLHFEIIFPGFLFPREAATLEEAGLSPQEREVLFLHAQGFDMQQIGARTDIKPVVVGNLLFRIRVKARLSHRSEIIGWYKAKKK